MEGEGMMAVVRGLRDGLAVTLLDSGRQYTLTPEAKMHPVTRSQRAAASQCVSKEAARKESGVQATDGRYASTYKMMHCHVNPTSPPEHVTEFPPQRAEVCHGRGNFEIGGPGSGETYCQATRCSGYRGGLCWTDRAIKSHKSSPTRTVAPGASNQAFSVTGSSSRNSSVTRTLNRSYDADVTSKYKKLDESPTREKPRSPQDSEPLESWRRPTFSKTTDVKYLREVVKNVRENTRSLSPQLSYQPERLSPTDYRGDLKSTSAQWSFNSVNMETQAAVEMVSREVVTVPRVVPSQRTVAIPLTPTSSVTETLDAEVSTEAIPELKIKQLTQGVQSFELSHVTLQTAISSIELCVHNHCSDRRSRSQEEIRVHTMETEIEHLLHALHIPSSSKSVHCREQAEYDEYSVTNNRPLWNGDRNVSKLENMIDVFKDIVPGTVKTHHSSKSFQAKLSLTIINDQDLAHVIHSWLRLIPIQTENIVEIELIYNYLCDLFRFYTNKFEIDWKNKLKSDIFEVLDLISIDSIKNRRTILNKLADILIEKVKNSCKRKRNKRNRNKSSKDLRISSFQKHAPAKGIAFEDIISKEIKLVLQIFSQKFNKNHIGEVENDLISIFTNFMKLSHSKNEKCIRNIIMQTLDYHGLSEYHAIYLTDILMKQLKTTMSHVEATYIENFSVFTTLQNSRPSTTKKDDMSGKNTEADSNTNNLVGHIEELSKAINDWLNSLKIPQIDHDKGLRQVVVHDLAGDIVDRHKYLELNPISRGSDATELEYLKYQIFKWVNKLVGEDNLKPIEYATDLRRRIQCIFQPILYTPRSIEDNSDKSRSDLDIITQSSCGNDCPKKSASLHKKGLVRFDGRSLTNLIKEVNLLYKDQSMKNTSEYADQYTGALDLIQDRSTEPPGNVHLNKTTDKLICSQSQSKECCSNVKLSPNTTLSAEQLNDEYEQFVKDWVKQIPIKSTNPEEEAFADKARLGIHKGIWKAVTKLNCEPDIYSNRFLYEDVLDDEVEDLISCLPQTPELEAKKHLLKIKLIEKTVNTIEQIYATQNASFKNLLIQNVANIIRKHKISKIDDENSDKFNEELLIMKLVEEYILSTKYQDKDKVKAETYKNKLLKQIDILFENLKKTECCDIQQIDLSSYKTDIIQTLQNVPLPSDNSVEEEADDILLGLEIEEWISDLPITFKDEYVEQYHRKKFRDILAKIIKETENHANSRGDIPQGDLKYQIKNFLEKTSVKEGENLNLDFIVDELTNRIKNRQKTNSSQITKRVAFVDPHGYEEFRKDVPFSSSLIRTPVLNENQSAPQENGNKLNSSTNQPCDTPKVDVSGNISDNQSDNTKYQQCCDIFDVKDQLNPGIDEINNKQWYTLRDSILPDNIETIKKDIETQSPLFYPYNVSNNPNFPKIIRKTNKTPKSNPFNRSCCNDNSNDDSDKQQFKNKQNLPMYVKSDSSLLKHQGSLRILNKSQASQTRKGILGTDQIAGCSKYTSNSKSIGENSNFNRPTQITLKTTEYDGNSDKSNQTNKICCESNDYNTMPILSANQIDPNNSTNSVSTSARQTGVNLYHNQSQLSALSSKINKECCHRDVGTSASFDDFKDCPEAKYFSTPKDAIISPMTPRGPSKRRAKSTTSENDAVRKRLDLDDSEDDEVRCRCIDRSWKRRRRPKYYLCGECEACPPILQMFYPYPCFL